MFRLYFQSCYPKNVPFYKFCPLFLSYLLLYFLNPSFCLSYCPFYLPFCLFFLSSVSILLLFVSFLLPIMHAFLPSFLKNHCPSFYISLILYFCPTSLKSFPLVDLAYIPQRQTARYANTNTNF